MGRLTGNAPGDAVRRARLYDLLANDFSEIEELLRSLFVSIPYEWHARNDIARYEGYYASVFYSYFAAPGLDVAVRINENIYLFEFKVIEHAGEGAAMA